MTKHEVLKVLLPQDKQYLFNLLFVPRLHIDELDEAALFAQRF